MNEKEFWNFWEGLRKSGNPRLVAQSLRCGEQSTDPAEEYIIGHSLLPAEQLDLAQTTITDLGDLLSQRKVSKQAKEAALILLAHQPSKDALTVLEKYNRTPDKNLEIFAAMALDECIMWNEE